jgi:Mrp family chromosome partitioning ATPase
VGAVADALVLSATADGVVLVCRAGKTSWQAARQVRQRLEDVGARILGVVINDLDLEKANQGMYHQYYQYYGNDAVDDDREVISA